MKLKRLLPKKSKRGVTLVEAVIAVVVLTMFATGVLTLLTTGRTKIAETAAEANAYAEATQKLDAVIATISNGGYLNADESETVTVTNSLKISDIVTELELGIDPSAISVTRLDCYSAVPAGTTTTSSDNVRGWYLTLTYNEATVKDYASNTEGVFDR